MDHVNSWIRYLAFILTSFYNVIRFTYLILMTRICTIIIFVLFIFVISFLFIYFVLFLRK